jgi:hypothetical protein
MILTVIVCVVFLLLAGINAYFSQPPNDFVLPDDYEHFIPTTFKSEGFYRAFVINVAFLGIATVTSKFQYGDPKGFSIPVPAMLALVSNIAFSCIAASFLKCSSNRIVSGKRIKLVIAMILVSLIVYAFSVYALVGDNILGSEISHN